VKLPSLNPAGNPKEAMDALVHWFRCISDVASAQDETFTSSWWKAVCVGL